MCRKSMLLLVVAMFTMLVSVAQADWTYVDCVDHALHHLAATNANMYLDPDGQEPVNAVTAWNTPDIRFRNGRVNGYDDGTLYEIHDGDPNVYVIIDAGAPGTYSLRLYGGWQHASEKWAVQTSLDGGMTWSEEIWTADIEDVNGIDGQGWVTTDTGLGSPMANPSGDSRGNIIIGEVTTDDGIIVVGIHYEGADRAQIDGLAYKAVVAPAPIAHWPLDGDATDVVGGHDGVIVGGVSWITDGALDGAVTFDISDPNAAIAVPHSEALDFGDVDFSISMMVRYPVVPGDPEHQLIMKGTFGGDDSGSRYTLFNKNGEFRYEIDNGTANVKSGIKIDNTPVVTGEWVHVVLVRDAVNDLLEMYIDGVLATSGTDNSGDISSGEDMCIGNTTVGNDRTCEADLDDIRIYNVALTEDDIAAMY